MSHETTMKLNERFPTEYLQILTHFYRGEMQRSTDWRKRLDTTTNWAIITMTAAYSWALTRPEARSGAHMIFFLTSWVVFLLLSIEARRYRYFDVWRTRVRMLEVHFLVPALNPEHALTQGDWREVLSNDLLAPSFKISFREAAAKRLIANYIWIFLGLQIGWCVSVYTSAVLGHGIIGALVAPAVDLESLYLACGFGWNPGEADPVIAPWIVLVGYGIFWSIQLWILVTTWRDRNVTGEIRRRDKKARKWPI
jgi:uncharacterized membrane protein